MSKRTAPPSSATRQVTERETIKVYAGELGIGMFVSELDRPWLESPFLLQGFELKTEADVRAVQDVCKYVYVDRLRSRTVTQAPAPAAPRPSARPANFLSASAKESKGVAPFQQELGKAAEVQHQTSSLLRTFIDDIRFGHSIDLQVAKSAVSECVSSILRNPDALMFLAQIKNRDEYTSQHSFNVCVYAIRLGRQLGMEARELENLGVCGLLHDMGKVQIPLEILNKEGRLNDEEFNVMKQHARFGRDILMSGRSVFSGTVDTAYGHHENMDGTGYPRGLEGHQVNLFTKVVSVVDKYDAITSHRVYQKGRTHLEALGILNQLSQGKIDPHLNAAFIACLGIYPVGSLVELTSGEVAVVLEQHPAERLRPIVLMVLGPDKRPIKERLADLSERKTDDLGRPYGVKRILDPEALKIDIRKYQPLIGSTRL